MIYSATLIIIVAIIYFIWQDRSMKKKLEYVKNTSCCVQAVKELNKKYKFKVFNPNPRYLRACKKKAQFDNFNIDSHLLATIEESPEYFETLINSIDYNRKKINQYEQQLVKNLQVYSNKTDYYALVKKTPLNMQEYKQIEKKICSELKIKPILDFKIELLINYTSPQGKNSYSKTCDLTYDNIIYYLNKYRKILKNRESAEYQRNLLTPSLRYEILMRDNKTCKICGATEADGAKLHVDHIIPVSKGGKTEPSNLRVLCDQCNLGKSNRYNPNGPN